MTVTEPGVAAGAVLTELRGIRDQLAELHNRMERPAPGLFDLTFEPLQLHTRLRVVQLMVGTDSDDDEELLVGTTGVFRYRVETGTTVFPLPIVIDRGTTVTVRDLSTGDTPPNIGNLVGAYLIAYTE